MDSGSGARVRGRKRPPDTPRARVPRTAGPPASPHDAGPAALVDALAAAGTRIRGRSGTQPVVGWLPTAGGAPVPSSPLIGEAPEGNPALHPWTLTTCPLAIPEAVELLCASIDKDALAPGVLVGKDLAFATEALRFAAGLVARQQFLPGLEERGGAWRDTWTHVVEGH